MTFFSVLHLGEHLYCHTDNLSKDLQGIKVAAVSGQRLANLTKGTLTKIRIDQSFDHFYANVARKSEGLLGEPTLPRGRARACERVSGVLLDGSREKRDC